MPGQSTGRERTHESSIPSPPISIFQQQQSLLLLELLLLTYTLCSFILLHHDLRQLQHACVAAAPARPGAPAAPPGFPGSAAGPPARARVPRFGSASLVVVAHRVAAEAEAAAVGRTSRGAGLGLRVMPAFFFDLVIAQDLLLGSS